MATTAVTAIVDEKLNHEASAVLAKLGMTVDDALRLLLTQVVQERTFPLAMHAPNNETVEAITESERGEGKHYDSLGELFRDMRE